MRLAQQKISNLNPYFYVPFLVWIIIGALVIWQVPPVASFLWINKHYAAWADIVNSIITLFGRGEVIAVILLLLLFIPRFRNWWYVVTAIVCNMVPFGIQQLLKSYFNYPRPLKVLWRTEQLHLLWDWDHLWERSFPSGHAEGAFSLCCFLSMLLPPRYRVWGLALFFLATAVAYSRLYLAAHFFEDVYVGSIVGTVITALLFTFMLRFQSSLNKKHAA
jgi:membrane-associated phospholipid phosphatase